MGGSYPHPGPDYTQKCMDLYSKIAGKRDAVDSAERIIKIDLKSKKSAFTDKDWWKPNDKDKGSEPGK